MPKAYRCRVFCGLLVWGLLACGGCVEAELTGSIRIEIIVPANGDPLTTAHFIRLRVEPEGTERTWPVQPLAPIDVGFPVDADGRQHSLSVEGLDEEGAVITAPRNFYTCAAKKGRVGKNTAFEKFPAAIPDDYNYPRKVARAEMDKKKELEQEKPFS